MYTDTTDVQEVQARQIRNDIQIQCNFITGSDAQGCMVVLVGDAINTTVNVTRCDAHSCSVVILISQPLSCYFEMFAYDIESDGSVGTLPIPGELLDKPISTMTVACAQSSDSGKCIHYVPIILLILYGHTYIISGGTLSLFRLYK